MPCSSTWPARMAIIECTLSISASKLFLSVALVPALERMLSTSSHTRIPGAMCASCALTERAWSCPDAQLCERKVWKCSGGSGYGRTSEAKHVRARREEELDGVEHDHRPEAAEDGAEHQQRERLEGHREAA